VVALREQEFVQEDLGGEKDSDHDSEDSNARTGTFFPILLVRSRAVDLVAYYNCVSVCSCSFSARVDAPAMQAPTHCTGEHDYSDEEESDKDSDESDEEESDAEQTEGRYARFLKRNMKGTMHSVCAWVCLCVCVCVCVMVFFF
jgi:hypothetical protein